MKNDIVKLDSKGINFNLILDEFLNLAEKFRCYFCKNLVKEPCCCGKCQECFCTECYNLYKKSKKNAKCPNFDNEINSICNNKLDERGFDMTSRETKLLNEIKIRCLNHASGCKDIFTYETFLKHVKSCKMRTYKCINKNCDFQSTKEKVNEHKINCEFLTNTCEYCKEEILNKILIEHLEICDEVVKFCYFCKKNFKVKELYSHNPNCKREYINFACEENFQKIDKYDEVSKKLLILEEEYKELTLKPSQRSTSNSLLGKKKKIIEDEEKNEKDEFDFSRKIDKTEKTEKIEKIENIEKDVSNQDINNNLENYSSDRNGKNIF